MTTPAATAVLDQRELFEQPRLMRVSRRAPVLRPSPSLAGVYGLDLTAGCFHGCRYCHIRGGGRYPGDDKVLFDPTTAERLEEELDAMEMSPRKVVLSPKSDPLPPLRDVRRVTEEVVELLLARRIEVGVMTRGRFSPALIAMMAQQPGLAKAMVGITTLDRGLSRTLEPRAASPRGRLRDVGRLISAGVDVEIRLEPLIPDRTDTRENLQPLFAALGRIGVKRVMAHSLFLHPSMMDSLETALNPLGWMEKLRDDYENGASFRVGSIGMTKHLPPDIRRANLAKLVVWGAQHGLVVTTGASQNPDLPHR